MGSTSTTPSHRVCQRAVTVAVNRPARSASGLAPVAWTISNQAAGVAAGRYLLSNSSGDR